MDLVDAGTQARLGRYVGNYEPDAASHDALDAEWCRRKSAISRPWSPCDEGTMIAGPRAHAVKFMS